MGSESEPERSEPPEPPESAKHMPADATLCFVPSPMLVWTRQPKYATARWSVHSTLLDSETTSIGSTGPPWALSGSREDAEDLVQETYARVLGRTRLLRNEDDLGYLLRALRNTFLNQKRAESRRLRPDALPDQLDLVADPHAIQPQAALEAAELYAAIAALPGDFRDVLVAVDVTGLSYKEAARALRIREGTVMSRLYRARQQVVRRVEGGAT